MVSVHDIGFWTLALPGSVVRPFPLPCPAEEEEGQLAELWTLLVFARVEMPELKKGLFIFFLSYIFFPPHFFIGVL